MVNQLRIALLKKILKDTGKIRGPFEAEQRFLNISYNFLASGALSLGRLFLAIWYYSFFSDSL